MASKKRKGVGQIMDDGTFIFTAYKKAVEYFGDKIIDKDVLSKLASNSQTVKRSNK